jgi:vancomycin resistance protein YoaR
MAIWSPGQSQSAEPAEVSNPAEAKMMERCQEMKEQKQKMKEDMKAQDAQLTNQITKMNHAPKDKKINLMAAIITRMVEQRIAMDARKAKMEEEMMQHMMKHMEMGKESMAKCPMMKDMDDKSGDDHKEYQKE